MKTNPTSLTEDFRNWLPTRIYRVDEENFVDWSRFESVRFTEPFFESSLNLRNRDAAQRPLVRQTSLSILKDLSGKFPVIKPTGFIFHVSRCGSTLISQILASTDENIVISEAPTIDTVIRGLHEKSERRNRAESLRWLISAYGKKRFAAEKNFFIKFDCWHTIDLDIISEAFPEVPWVFLYRNPVEVIVSHLRKRGMQMMPGVIENLLPDFEISDIVRMLPEEYCARVLKRICESALDYANHPNALLVNYSELPEAVFTKIFVHFNVNYESEQLAKMQSATKRDAKMPQIAFKPDIKDKNAEASEKVRVAAARHVAPVYEKLEGIRLSSRNN